MKGVFQMEETKKAIVSRFDKSQIRPFKELTNDGRKYTDVFELQKLNLFLQCYSNRGVIVTGPEGSGKTALVNMFAQQNLPKIFNVESIRLVQLSKWCCMDSITPDAVVGLLVRMIEAYKSSLIIYAKFEEAEKILKVINIMDGCVEAIKEHYGIDFIKFIFEYSIRNEEELKLYDCIPKNYEVVDCFKSGSLFKNISIITPRIDEMAEKYNISYTEDVLNYFFVIYDGVNKKNIDFNNCVGLIEKAFVISKMKGRKSIEKDIAAVMFENEFAILKNASSQNLYSTAVHEAGHTLLKLLSDKDDPVMYVTIIPTLGSIGRTTYDVDKTKYVEGIDVDSCKRKIACSLAGRIAENIILKDSKPDSGAKSDLETAMKLADRFVLKCGAFESIGRNYSVTDVNSVSERLKEKIEAEKRQMLKDAEGYAANEITKHAKFIIAVADKLVRDYYILQEDIYKMWNKYCESLK